MSVKKILIIAHFFEPCNVIAAHRPKSWAKSLAQAGHEVTVLTRHWNGTENDWVAYLAEDKAPVREINHPDGYKIIYHPFKKSFFQRIYDHKLINSSKALRFLVELTANLFGKIDFDRDTYSNYFPFLNTYLTKHPTDVVLTTSGPYITIKLASVLKREHNFTWFADFRDVWNNDLLKVIPAEQLKRNRIRFLFHKKHIKKWLKRVDTILSCSEGFDPVFKEIAPNKPVVLIKNGYENHLFDGIETQEVDQFTILCLGTLYQEQEKQFFFEAVKGLIAARGTEKINIKFIGAKINEAVAQEITSQVDNQVLTLTGFVDRKSALQEIKNAHLLFYPVWKGYRGIYSGKIFEYLGSKRNIIILPKDHSVLDQLLKESGAGSSFDSIELGVEHLIAAYDAWETTGTVPYHGNDAVIASYTREHQAHILLQEINKLQQL